MTAVDTVTGEIVATGDMGEAEARERLGRVKGHVAAAWDDLVALWSRRAWLSLGHPSWDALCDAELDGARIALPREQRREVVGRMREAGMSTRAIGSAVGVHHDTVAQDIKATVGFPTVERPAAVISLDGRRRPAIQPPRSRVPAPMPSDAEQRADADRMSASALTHALVNLGSITPGTCDSWVRVWRTYGVGTPREVLLGDAGLSRDVIDKAVAGLRNLQKGLGL